MNRSLLLILLVFSLGVSYVSCDLKEPKESKNEKEFLEDEIEETGDSIIVADSVFEEVIPDEKISDIEQALMDAGLVNVQDVDPSIHIDVKYATEDNFMGEVLYQDYAKVYLQPIVAEKLATAQKTLKAIDSSLTLLVFDGTRPRFVQQQMWDALDTIPISQRTKFLSNPKNGSIHNYGCAVDLTIMDLKTGEWLDMGAGYDDMREIAYPRHESRYLSSGELTQVQVDNRVLLRNVMKAGGFWVIETEWWHFNAYTRDKAKELFKIVE